MINYVGLLNKAEVDLTEDTEVLLYKEECENHIIPMCIMIVGKDIDTVTVNPSVSVGTNSTSYNNILLDTLLDSLETNDVEHRFIMEGPVVDELSNVYIKINTNATATKCIVDVYLMGIEI